MKNGEKGQAIVIAMVLLAFGGLVIAPFLNHAGSGLIGSRLYKGAMDWQYAGDAGVEQAIWNLRYGGLASQLPNPGDSVSYQLGESVNGLTPNITVSKAWLTIASDNFESGGWNGGTGWLAPWTHTGSSNVTNSGTPYLESLYHLRLLSSTGYARRAVDLSGLPGARLQFWAKANSFEGSENAQCLVSPNGASWTPVRTWVRGEDDDIYRYNDIDLTPYTLSSNFRIAFQANMSGTGDYFYVDDLRVVWAFDTPALASEDFESGGWAGGTGWLAAWTHTGDSSILNTGNNSYQGIYYLRLRRGTGYARRAVNLSSLANPRLQFWAKANSFEGGEHAHCLISPDGTSWTEVRTWVANEADNIYRYNDIDLTPYTLSSNFRIAFTANMTDVNDQLYVDDLKIKGPPVYGIRSTVDGKNIWAVVEIAGGTVRVLRWQVI